ncbi:MAG: hypothetical protein GY906_39130 [bacterium]|nr:hypothetical protein [bacterium]
MSDIPNYDAHIEGERVFAESLACPSEAFNRALCDWRIDSHEIIEEVVLAASISLLKILETAPVDFDPPVLDTVISDLQSAKQALPPRPTID